MKAPPGNDDPRVTRIDITGELSIFTASALREQFLDALDTASELEIDLSGVSEIDSAGIQLMVAAKKEAMSREKSLRFTGHSPAVYEVLELFELSGHFGDPLLIQSKTA